MRMLPETGAAVTTETRSLDPHRRRQTRERPEPLISLAGIVLSASSATDSASASLLATRRIAATPERRSAGRSLATLPKCSISERTSVWLSIWMSASVTDFCAARLDESKLAATSLSRSGTPESMRGVPEKDAARYRYGVKSMSSSEGGSFAHRIRLSVKNPSLPLSLSGWSKVDFTVLGASLLRCVGNRLPPFDPGRSLRRDRPAGNLLKSCKLTSKLAAGDPVEDDVVLI